MLGPLPFHFLNRKYPSMNILVLITYNTLSNLYKYNLECGTKNETKFEIHEPKWHVTLLTYNNFSDIIIYIYIYELSI